MSYVLANAEEAARNLSFGTKPDKFLATVQHRMSYEFSSFDEPPRVIRGGFGFLPPGFNQAIHNWENELSSNLWTIMTRLDGSIETPGHSYFKSPGYIAGGYYENLFKLGNFAGWHHLYFGSTDAVIPPDSYINIDVKPDDKGDLDISFEWYIPKFAQWYMGGFFGYDYQTYPGVFN